VHGLVGDAEVVTFVHAPGCPAHESWFGKLKEREVWLNEYETLDQARRGIGGYVDRYHHRPHSGLNYRTPDEVRQTWEDLPERRKQAA
jgi:putative transposase